MNLQFLAVFAGIPFAVFLGLVLLPPGRALRLGFGLVVALILGAWVYYLRADDPWGQVLTVFSATMAILAALAQMLRPHGPGWVYGAVVMLIPAGVAGAIFYLVRV